MYEAETIYHIYNQSNNYELLFRSEDNYLFFLKKIRTHLLPIGEVLCYCLMPDHFHLLYRLNETGVKNSVSAGMRPTWENDEGPAYMQELSHQLKIMLSSYTNAFNKRHGRRGSLFRAKTKAKPAYVDFQRMIPNTLAPDGSRLIPYVPYLRTCFYYIHDNPRKAGLVAKPEDWPYSSASDYLSLRNGTLCNYELADRLLDIQRM